MSLAIDTTGAWLVIRRKTYLTKYALLLVSKGPYQTTYNMSSNLFGTNKLLDIGIHKWFCGFHRVRGDDPNICVEQFPFGVRYQRRITQSCTMASAFGRAAYRI
jgi:hypothetical protein